MPKGRVVYDIPRTVDVLFDEGIVSLDKLGVDGDVDYGPHYRISYDVTFDHNVDAATAAKAVGDHLAFNYQDDFRQVQTLEGGFAHLGETRKQWTVLVHLAWGDRPYYTPVTP